MAYTRKNLLLKIIDIQNITLEETKKGATQESVFNNLIYPKYLISKRTYYRYLSVNARKEIKELTGEK